MVKHLRQPVFFLLVAVVAHLVIWAEAPLFVQALAALVVTGFLPGFVLSHLWLSSGVIPWTQLERLLFGIACGYTVTVVGMLLLSYLPGGIPRWLPLMAFDLLLLLLLGLLYWRASTKQAAPAAPTTTWSVPKLRTRRWVLLGLLLLLVIGGFFRLVNLGYAEFLTDEARVVLRAQAVIQGDENVLFVHRKGPTEILLPAAIWAITGRIDEFAARLPFALASLAGLFAVFCLGRRLHSALAGWIAAMLLAFEGYLIGFARFTQYQSVIFLTSALVILLLFTLVQKTGKVSAVTISPREGTRVLSLATVLLATGLLSHYDAALTLIPALWLLGVLIWQKRQAWLTWVQSSGLALLVGGSLLLLFYPRFLLHPHFEATYTYLTDRRLAAPGLRFPYNNLLDIFQRSVIYNSAYAVILSTGVVLVGVVLAYRRGWGRRWAMYSGIGLVLLMVATLLQPGWLKFGMLDLALLPSLLALFGVWMAPRLSLEERLLWLWFGLLALLAYFFVAFPRTHVYIFFMPRALLIGGILAQGWRWLYQRYGAQLALTTGSLATVSACLVFGVYAYWYFVDDHFEVLRTWRQNRLPGYWLPTGDQESDALYGFPVQNGWKTIGVLYQQGVLQGDYDSNQRDNLVSQWYTRGQNRCASTAEWYFQIDNLEEWSGSAAIDEQTLQARGYRRWGAVEVNDISRLAIYRLDQGRGESVLPNQQLFKFDEYAARFDQLTTTPFPLQYPAIEPPIPNPVRINFGDRIWLEGYDVSYPQPLRPGATVRLTLFWRAQQADLPDYKVFNHVLAEDGTLLTQSDSHPVCDRQRTSTWYPGELVVDVHEIELAADTPIGDYPLYTGLYLEDNLVRLPVLNGQGEAVDQQVHVANLLIEAVP